MNEKKGLPFPARHAVKTGEQWNPYRCECCAIRKADVSLPRLDPRKETAAVFCRKCGYDFDAARVYIGKFDR